MTVDTMRRIDKWIGIPLTAILSLLCWLIDLLRFKNNIPDTTKTLFIELSEMGSAIIVDPALRKLKRETGAQLYFAIFKKNAISLSLLKTVPEENIFKMDADNLKSFILDTFRFIGWCRKKRITTVVDLELFSRFTAILSFFSGAAWRIGFSNFHDEGLYRGSLINGQVRYNPHVHISVNFISLINKSLSLFHLPYATTPVLQNELQLAKAEILDLDVQAVRTKITQLYPDLKSEKLVLFNVNASDMLPQRRWQQEKFITVAQQLLDEFSDILIIATGSADEKDYVEKVVAGVANKRCVNSSGVFAFSELAPLYSISALMLTNDSGPAHFASVTSLKVFVLFGPETPNLYLPLGGNAEAIYLGLPCSPCVSAANHRETTCVERPCITGISPIVVFEKLRNYLLEN